jgi:hypothetical protein
MLSLNQAHPDTHLFLRYEDMIDDPHAAVLAIANFLEIPVTDEIVAKVGWHNTICVLQLSILLLLARRRL